MPRQPLRDRHTPPEPCVAPPQRRRGRLWQDHGFVARGVCGWPQDEHPPVPVPDP